MQSDLIFDLGMHVGQDTGFYLKKGFRVVAVEANPALVAAGRRRFARAIRQGRLVIVGKGISRRAATLPFYVNKTSAGWSSFMPEIGQRGGRYETVEVETVAMDEIFERHGIPYFMKVDIEGHDHYPLDALAARQGRPRFISIENGQPEMLRRLVALGYDRFKWINQGEVARQRLPFPPREGGFCFHRFRFESSGAFGEETPGEWVDADTVTKQIARYWETPQLDASKHGWFDLHARLASR